VSEVLSIQWRGPLDSCNYACRYCPFAGRSRRHSTLAQDEADLGRFVAWLLGHPSRTCAVVFTPRGEALIHAWYREALVSLSHAAHVRRACIQTNGSTSWRWLHRAVVSRLSLWITWHPAEVSADRFLRQIAPALESGVACSVGCVGVPSLLPSIEDMHARLPPSVGFWVNALRPHASYKEDEVRRLTALDPQFVVTSRPQATRGKSCRAGLSAIAVSGDGTVRRCHFVDEPLGNLYRDELETLLRDRPCPRRQCDCYLGMVHLDGTSLWAGYGGGRLERAARRAPADTAS
jgi:MoaA/NifB/PqqE/SkfB family radical SAM enzyme